MKTAINTTIDELLIKNIDILARREKRSRSNMIEIILSDYMDKHSNSNVKTNNTDDVF